MNQTIPFEDFLQLEAHAEWVEGKIISLAAVDLRHAELRGWLAAIMRLYVSVRGLGSVYQEPFVMRPAPHLPGRSPDILFLATAHRTRLKPGFLDGPADVAVEAVSPGSQGRDRGEKFYEYEQGGVTEYWLLDPIRKRAEFYGLDANGLFALLPTPGGRFYSLALPGFWLLDEWLWSDPLPREDEILRELGVI